MTFWRSSSLPPIKRQRDNRFTFRNKLKRDKLLPRQLTLQRKPNSDGLIKCLRQPGLLQSQPLKSMLENLCGLLNSLHLDSFVSRDKVYVGLPATALAPCFLLVPISPWHVTSLPSIWTCYRFGVSPWPEAHCRLPGLAKNKSPRHRRHLIKPPGR